MRRTVVGTALALTLVGVSGNGTAAEDETAVHPPQKIPEMPVPPDVPAYVEPEVPLVPVDTDVPTPLAPPITTGFEAIPDNNLAIPPDTHGAVGPTKVVTVLNTEVQHQDRDGSNPVKQTLNNFWTTYRTDGAFDPRVKYDPDPAYGGRWIHVAVQGARASTSGTLVAVSDGVPTPTDLDFGLLVDADPAPVTPFTWADYPTVGFNKHWVVVQVNMFDEPGGTFDRSVIYVFDKARLYAGTTGACMPAPSVTGCTLIETTTLGATHVPAATYDFTIDELYLLNRWNSGAGALRLFVISGAIGSEVLTPLGFPLGPAWSNSAPGSLDFAPQSQAGPGCFDELGATPLCPDCKFQTNDSRVQNLVYRDGSLWTAHTVFYPSGGAPTRSSIQWWEIATDAAVLQRSVIDDALLGERFYAFPSIAVNRHRDVLIGYSTFISTAYASANYSFRYGTDPPSTLQPEQLLVAGQDCYFKDLGTTRNRWGDYSHTVVDPTDDIKLWTIQEFAATSDTANPIAGLQDKWSTWWGMMDPTRTIVINDVSLAEGDAGTTAFVFTLSLTDAAMTEAAPTPLPVSVQWDTSDGTATVADSDYVPVVSGVVNFAPGETTKSVQVDVNGDIKFEPNETFFVDLSNPTNAVIGDNQGQGTIQNDDPLPQVSISDVQKVEGNGGFEANPFTFKLTLSNPSSTQVDVDWNTTDGTATSGPANDFTADANTAMIPAETLELDIVIRVHGDVVPEPTELFTVDLTGVIGATILKSQGVGRIIDDDAATPGVEALSAVAGGGPAPGSGTTLLQWFTPAGAAGGTFFIEANQSAAVNGNCLPPGPLPGGGTIPIVPPAVLPVVPGTVQSLNVPVALNPDFEYCYSVWIGYPGPPYSAVASVSARPYDSTGKVKWKLFSGGSALAQPAVGMDAVVAPSNDSMLHSMVRGGGGGPWPAPWLPVHLGAVSQHRTAIVPLGGVSRAFVATQDGRVHAIDTMNGGLLWSTQLPEGAALAAPAGIFTAFSGPWDYLLVGTSAGLPAGDRFYALDPFTGAVIDAFPQPADGVVGTIGPITSMASIDYANNLVFFTSWQGTSNGTVWALNLGAPSDALSLAWKFDGPVDVSGSPVLHNGRVLLGDTLDRVWSHDAVFGDVDQYNLPLGDGASKGFLFPDRRNDRLYVATNTTVWALRDTGAAIVTVWPSPGLNAPSVVLHHPGTDDIYVGVQDHLGTGAVLRLDATDGSIASFVPLENGPLTIGPSSLDIGFGMLHVGSVAGTLYAIELPF